MLAVLALLWLPGQATSATATCPPAPSLTAKTYEAAASELTHERSILVPRRHSRASALPADTILGAPQVSLEKGTCYLDIAVSDGSLSKRAATLASRANVAGAGAGERMTDSTSTPAAKPTPDRSAPGAATPSASPSSPPDQGRADRTKAITDILGALVRPTPGRGEGAPPPSAPSTECRQLPKFSPQTFQAAVAAFERFRVPVKVNRVDRPSDAPAGTLLEPPTQQRGPDGVCTVTLVTSEGPVSPPVSGECPPLPKFSSQTVDAASAALQSRRVKVNRVTRASSAPAGTLLEPPTQQRGADRVCVVTLVASDGSLVRVPAVVGMTRDKAQSTVLAAKLLFEAAEALSKAPPGTVLAQDPRAGAEVPRGTIVQTTIARVELVVPAVIGLQTAVARQRMARFKIDEAVEEGIRPAGEIVRQDPQAGERRPPGAIVRIVASDGSLVEVPAVTGQKVDVARRRLEVAGLGFATSLQDDGAEPETVLVQTPAANVIVKRGSNVTLAVSRGLGVPNVVDMQFDAAHAALGQFSVESMAAESTAPFNRVLGQSLAPGTRVAAGTVIRLSVSDASLVKVPDVRQMALSLARAALADAGLRARLDRGPDMDSAQVTEQEPSPETVVKRSSDVALVSRWVIPWWLWPLGGALTLAGAVAAYLRWGRTDSRARGNEGAKPPQPLEVSASVEFRPAPPQPAGAGRAGPDISVEARLLPGETQLEVEEELHA